MFNSTDIPLPNPSPEGKGLRCFADVAGRLAGVAGALLGWRPDEFWRATPAELGAVLRALAPEADAGLDSRELERLRALFPD
ncbi:MAG TPA: phage tail assembly chaperone [Allosphingosinicella sp.]|jgi:hypothetical protein